MIQTKILLPSTGGLINVYGEPVEAIGFYSQDTDTVLNTLSFYTSKFVGRIHVYGTLSMDKDTADWAELNISGKAVPYIEMDDEKSRNLNNNFFVNIEGNYTYLKAEIERSYLPYVNTNLISNTNCKPEDYYIINEAKKERIVDTSRYRDEILDRVGLVNRIMLSF